MVLHRPVELAGIIGMWPKLPEAKKPDSGKWDFSGLGSTFNMPGCPNLLEAKRIHFRLLVHIVFPGISELIFKSATLRSQRPSETLSRRQCLRFA